MWKKAILYPLVLLVVVSTRPSAAQQPGLAEDLYERGVAAFHRGDYEAACRQLDASYRLEPLPGVLFTLATCEMRAGRTATALARYREFDDLVAALPAEQQHAQAERRQVAGEQRALLLADLPYLKISLDARFVSSVRLELDGQRIMPEDIGQELPVNPGEHVIRIRALDGRESEQRIAIAKRERRTLVVMPPANPPAPSDAPPVRQDEARAEPGVSPYLTYIFGGVAALGIVVGSSAGILAINNKGIVNDECDGDACTPRGKVAADKGRTQALVSSVGFGTGIAALAALAVVYWTAPSASDEPPRAGVSHLELSGHTIRIGGTF